MFVAGAVAVPLLSSVVLVTGPPSPDAASAETTAITVEDGDGGGGGSGGDNNSGGGGGGGGLPDCPNPVPAWPGSVGSHTVDANGAVKEVRVINCIDSAGEPASYLAWVTVTTLEDITEPVVARAVANVPYPEPSFLPAVDNPWTYVNMATSVWVDSWESVAESDTAFGITVTVTVIPESLEFSPGDGSPTVVCAGQPSGPDQCAYTYRRSSGNQPDLVYPGQVTQHWRIEITRTLGGDEVRPLSLSTDQPVGVAEIQTVVES